LGHSLGPIRAIYDRHSFEPEMRIAFEKLSALISNITNPTDRVVPMARKLTPGGRGSNPLIMLGRFSEICG
jgi:hypothetical protein